MNWKLISKYNNKHCLDNGPMIKAIFNEWLVAIGYTLYVCVSPDKIWTGLTMICKKEISDDFIVLTLQLYLYYINIEHIHVKPILFDACYM